MSDRLRELTEKERAELAAHELWVNNQPGGKRLGWRGRELQSADLRGAYLWGADLRGAILNWQSHNLLSEILRQAAGDDPRRRMLAGLVSVSPDWCWDTPELLDALAAMPDEAAWAIETLADWVGPDEECGLTRLAAGDYAPDDMPDEDEEE